MDHLDIETAHQLIAGGLPPAETARWMTHIAACERCRALLDRERNWSGLMRLGDPAATLPEDPEIPVHVAGPAAKTRVAPLAIRAGVWTAIACLGAAGLVWQWTHRPDVGAQPAPLTGEEIRAAALQAELATLLDDPWIATDLETLLELDRLLGAKQ